jgi:PAS domain S-box-containing protein
MRRPAAALLTPVPGVGLLAARGPRRAVAAALLLSAAYYGGAKVGLALTFGPNPVSTLWPPNAILLAGLLLTPPGAWWIVLLVALPAHLVAELGGGVPVAMVLCWFVSNAAEALIGAECVRRFARGPLRFDRVRDGTVFVLLAGVLAAFLSSFLDAGFVALNRWGQSGYWDVWRMRLLSNLLATLTLVPAIVTARHGLAAALRAASGRRLAEGAVLATAVVVVSVGVFAARPAGLGAQPYLLAAPLPLLLWAALRFGPGGTSAAILTVALVSIWSAVHGLGPFAAGAPHEAAALALQIFLILTGVPLLLLATVLEERGRAVDAVRRSEDRLQQALDSAGMGTWELHVPTDTVVCDEETGRLLGLAVHDQEIPLARVYESVHPDDRDAVAQAIAHAIATGALRAEFRIVHPDGTVHWAIARGRVTYDGAGHPARITGLVGDITARKRAELALRDSEQRMALAAAAGDLGFWGVDLRTGQTWSSEQGRRVGGLPEEAHFSVDDWLAMVHPEDRQRVSDALRASLAGATSYDQQFRFLRPDGAVRWMHAIARVLRDGAGDQLVGVVIDTTERELAAREVREQQRQMAHLARVAVVGELSGTIAHELNQPLAAILTNAQVAVRMLDRGAVDLPELRAILADIVDDDRRAGAVIQRIRGLLRNDALVAEPLALADLVSDALVVARGELAERAVALQLDVGPALPRVRGDRVQLQQLLLNLIVNACDAMVAVPLPERRLTVVGAPDPAGGVHLSIADTGPGIAVTPVERVFEPFVSSKAGGLGLGLTICRSIVVAHGGQIWAENGASGGAAFHVVLPAAAAVGEAGASA